MEIEIPQRSLVFPILFLIYISGVFLKIKSQLSQITCLLFIDDLRFLSTSNFVKKIKNILENARKITLD